MVLETFCIDFCPIDRLAVHIRYATLPFHYISNTFYWVKI